MSKDQLTKKIYFYKTFPQPSLYLPTGSDYDKLFYIFNTSFKQFPEQNIFSFESSSGEYSIEVKSFDKKHLFGIFCKNDDNHTKLMRLRNTVTNETSQIIPDSNTKTILEYYSFFYIDFEKAMTAVISNKQTGKFENILNAFLQNECSYVNFIPFTIQSIDDALKLFKKIKSIDAVYTKNSSKSKFKRISEFNDNYDSSIEVEALSVKLSVKDVGIKFLNEIKAVKSNEYEKYRINGESEDGIEQIFDLVKRIFMRSAEIDIEGNPEKSIELIESTLKAEIDKIIKDQSVINS